MCEQDNKANHTRQFARDLLPYETTYRNHKETMAHAALVLQVVFFAWIMRENSRSGETERCLSIILLFILYLYVRWQLRKRRFSAIRIAATYKTLVEWETAAFVTKELKWAILNLMKFFDWLIPLPIFYFFPANYMINSILPDSAADKYPAPLSKAIQNAANEKALSWYIGEYLVSFASFLIWLIGFLC